MARKGENIRKRSDGRWEARYPVFEDGTSRYHSIYAKTYAEAKKKLLEHRIKNPEFQISEAPSGGYGEFLCQLEREKIPLINDSQVAYVYEQAVKASYEYQLYMKNCMQENKQEMMLRDEVVIDDVAKCWLNHIKQERKTATYAKYETIYRIYIQDIFGHKRISYFNHVSVNNFFPEGCSESTIKSIYCVINQIIAYSNRHFHTSEILVERKSIQRKNSVIRIFSQSEQRCLVRYLYQDMDIYKLGILLCLSLGLRLGEICALRWEDIDFDMRILYVKRTVQRIALKKGEKTVLIENEPKTASSKREIPISDQLYELLQEFKSADKYLLNGKHPMEPRTYQYKFKRYLQLAGITDANFHVLRHTFATNCIGYGADVKSVSEILGHSDVKITLNRYVHPTLDTKRNNINLLDVVYGKYLECI